MKHGMNTMMILGAALVASFSQVALADGFTCQSVADDLNVKVYNNTQPELGTRTAAVMVISDPLVSGGRKTIARFTDVRGTLSSEGASYLANVDLRFNDSSRKGELIGGTKLGYVDTISLDVDHNFSQPVEAGTDLAGQLTIVKRGGQEIAIDLVCERYLKN